MKINDAPASKLFEHEVLNQIWYNVVPESQNQLGINLFQPTADEVYHIPKCSTSVRFLMMTYLLPVRNEFGLRSPCFKYAKANSIGAVEYEYGADMMT